MSRVIVSVALALSVGGLAACHENYDVLRCNGADVIVLSNDQMFAAYATEVQFELNAAAKTKAELAEISAGTKYNKTIKDLYEQLDNLTAQFKTELYAEYGMYLNQLCNAKTPDERRAAADAWAASRQRAQDFALKMRAINQQVAVVKSSTSGSSQQLEHLVDLQKEAVEAGRVAAQSRVVNQ
jgi:hypothetical protein